MRSPGKSFEARFAETELRSFSPRAIQWGLDLFEHCKKQAKPVKLSDYL